MLSDCPQVKMHDSLYHVIDEHIMFLIPQVPQ